MKSIPKVPIFGQPVFVISENSLEDRLNLSGERGLLNTLVYFAVDGILVKALEYEDEKMQRVLINKGMHVEGDETKSLELHMDFTREVSREDTTIFVDEIEAQAVARKMNENQKKSCRKLLDLATKAFNEYDKVIAASSVDPTN